MKRRLLVQLMGLEEEIIIWLRFLEDLHSVYPTLGIDLLVSKDVAPLLPDQTFIHRVWGVDEYPPYPTELVLRRNVYDIYIAANPHLAFDFRASRMRIAARIGSKEGWMAYYTHSFEPCKATESLHRWLWAQIAPFFKLVEPEETEERAWTVDNTFELSVSEFLQKKDPHLPHAIVMTQESDMSVLPQLHNTLKELTGLFNISVIHAPYFKRYAKLHPSFKEWLTPQVALASLPAWVKHADLVLTSNPLLMQWCEVFNTPLLGWGNSSFLAKSGPKLSYFEWVEDNWTVACQTLIDNIQNDRERSPESYEQFLNFKSQHILYVVPNKERLQLSQATLLYLASKGLKISSLVKSESWLNHMRTLMWALFITQITFIQGQVFPFEYRILQLWCVLIRKPLPQYIPLWFQRHISLTDYAEVYQS